MDGLLSPKEEYDANGQKRPKGTPYIPSYMDLSNGPEPCVVCGDAATGYHYRCMTCEGCKGFFRRTIQKSLQYHCKWNGSCQIDKTTRNQCQKCRFNKCLAVGMATDLVLNEKQRVAKRKLIQENRERRRQEAARAAVATQQTPTAAQTVASQPTPVSVSEAAVPSLPAAETITSPSVSVPSTQSARVKHPSAAATEPSPHSGTAPSPQESSSEDSVTDEDRNLIREIAAAYEQTAAKTTSRTPMETADLTKEGAEPEVWQQLAEVMTPSIVKVVEFAKRVPGFIHLNVDDQILLLKSCCMEIMCLRAACRYQPSAETITLQNGMTLRKEQLQQGGLGIIVEPIFEFAVSLAKLKLDSTEIALLAAILLMQSDRTGLKEAEAVEKLQDSVLGAFKRYVCEMRPQQPVHWAKILMKVTDLRGISARHAERVLCIKLDCADEFPSLFFDMFDTDLTNTKIEFPPSSIE